MPQIQAFGQKLGYKPQEMEDEKVLFHSIN